jgi:hypothetical protein
LIFEKIKKQLINPSANMTRSRREETQINKIRDEKEEIMTNNNENNRIMKTYIQTNLRL